jgi:hypothetical protein
LGCIIREEGQREKRREPKAKRTKEWRKGKARRMKEERETRKGSIN